MADEIPITSQRSRRRRRNSPVPLEIIQKNIAVSMAQVIVNMTDPALQAHCMHLLQISDVLQADGKILEIIENIDAKEQTKRHNANANCRRRLYRK